MLIAIIIWKENALYRYLGYKSVLEFILFHSHSSQRRTAKKRLREKAHHLTFMGLRTIKAVDEEHGPSNKMATIKKKILMTKSSIEKDQKFELKKFEDKNLLVLGGESGRKLREFVLEWNRLDGMARWFNEMGSE